MQTRAGGGEDPSDDVDGLRDFSAATVQRRREQGYVNACNNLYPVFLSRNLVTPDQVRRAAAPSGS